VKIPQNEGNNKKKKPKNKIRKTIIFGTKVIG
jgi:hypothetical protein